jgi:hypothetical protein
MPEPRKCTVSRSLYHATTRAAAREIAKHGFKPSGVHCKLGSGVYFARSEEAARTLFSDCGGSPEVIIKIEAKGVKMLELPEPRKLKPSAAKEMGSMWVIGVPEPPAGCSPHTEYVRKLEPGHTYKPPMKMIHEDEGKAGTERRPDC